MKLLCLRVREKTAAVSLFLGEWLSAVGWEKLSADGWEQLSAVPHGERLSMTPLVR